MVPTLALLLSLLLSPQLFAQEEPAQDGPVDVRLVIDVSGSMKQNDPNNLRQPAVGLLVELLPEGSKAGVWTFGKWVNMLIPHKPVDDSWRTSAGEESKKINSVGLFTNIGGALEKAAYDQGYADPEQKKHIILLTDGMVDIDKNAEANKKEWRRIADEVLPKLRDRGYVVHTIALSNNADRDLMNKLSVATDGMADVAYSADDLMKIFLKAFDAAVPSEQVALSDNAFVVDSSVEEFTALFFRANPSEQTQIITPDQQTWDASTNDSELRWHRTEYYDLVTVKRPLEGSWNVIGELDAQSRVTVVSNLNMRMRPLPNNVLKGTELNLDVFLQEDGKTISNPDFLSLMKVRAELLGGKQFDSLVSLWSEELARTSSIEGRYISTLPALEKEGVYEVRVVVDGKTFTRSIKHQVTLRQAFGAEVRETFENGNLHYLLTVNAFKNEVDYASTQVVASITKPTGQKVVRPLLLSELDVWQTKILPSAEGKYLANIQVKGTLTDGTAFQYDLDELTFNYSIDAGMVAEEEPFVDEKPEEPVSEDDAEPAPVVEPEVAPVVPAQEESGLPDWILYAALGLGNLLLIGLGYFAYRKIMGAPKQDILDELDQAVAEEPEAAVAEAAEPQEEAEPEDDEEEEPPMEDLDPDSGSDTEIFDESDPIVEAVEAEPESPELLEPEDEIPELSEADIVPDAADAEDDIPTLDAEEDLAADLIDEVQLDDEVDAEEANAEEVDLASNEPDKVTNEDEAIDLDELDDLDAMTLAMDAQESDSAEEASEEESDDMVEAMLKAQGLDLAEEELDDAISSLIDDLEDNDEKKS